VSRAAHGSVARTTVPALQGIHKIQHVIVITQENRSFDSYFGTFPGADGLPKGVCVPDPLHGGCVKPYVDHADSDRGGPHVDASSIADVNGGKMNVRLDRPHLAAAQGPRPPRPPLILNPCPRTTLTPSPGPGCMGTVALNFASWADSWPLTSPAGQTDRHATAVTRAPAAADDGQKTLALAWADSACNGEWTTWSRREPGITIAIVALPRKPARIPGAAPPLGRRARPRLDHPQMRCARDYERLPNTTKRSPDGYA
jgi:hypothetical protein